MTDFQHYYETTPEQKRAIVATAKTLSPAALQSKVMFLVPHGDPSLGRNELTRGLNAE